MYTALAGAASADRGAALMLRASACGALYYKIATGEGDASRAIVSEPVSFCPFCGAKVGTAHADQAGAPTSAARPADDDEEVTILADDLKHAGVGRPRRNAFKTVAMTVAL